MEPPKIPTAAGIQMKALADIEGIKEIITNLLETNTGRAKIEVQKSIEAAIKTARMNTKTECETLYDSLISKIDSLSLDIIEDCKEATRFKSQFSKWINGIKHDLEDLSANAEPSTTEKVDKAIAKKKEIMKELVDIDNQALSKIYTMMFGVSGSLTVFNVLSQQQYVYRFVRLPICSLACVSVFLFVWMGLLEVYAASRRQSTVLDRHKCVMEEVEVLERNIRTSEQKTESTLLLHESLGFQNFWIRFLVPAVAIGFTAVTTAVLLTSALVQSRGY